VVKLEIRREKNWGSDLNDYLLKQCSISIGMNTLEQNSVETNPCTSNNFQVRLSKSVFEHPNCGLWTSYSAILCLNCPTEG